MDNAKSIIDIEVNDDQFKAFHALFEKYRSNLGDIPSILKQTSKASDGVNAAEKKSVDNTEKRLGTMQDLTKALAAHAAILDKGAAVREKTAREEAKYEKSRNDFNKRLESSEARQNALIEKRQKYIKEMSNNLSGVIGKTASIGINIGKWGVGIGLAMAGGGFFGMDRLGQSATADRSTARGLGVSSGALRAWRTDFAPYGNPDGLLSASSNAYSDPMMRATLQRAGVGSDVIKAGNTSQIAEQALRGLADFYNRNQGPNAQQIWQSRGFNNVIGFNEMRQFAGASEQERNRMFANIRRDTSSLGNSDPTLLAWQNFSTQLTRAGQQIKATFLDGLGSLTGPMSKLSDALQNVIRQFMSSGAFSEVIKIVSQGLNDLAQSFKDGSAQKGIQSFISAISKWAKDGTLEDDLMTIERGIHKLASVLGWFAPGNSNTAEGRKQQTRHNILTHGGMGALVGGAVGGVAGSVIPGAGTLAGGALGASVGGAIGTFLAGTKDAKYLGYQPVDIRTHNRLFKLAQGLGIKNDYEAHILAAIGSTESRGNPNAVSSAGAMGLMQIIPQMQKALGVTNPFDETQSMRGGARLFEQLYQHFKGDLTKTVAGYNTGQPNVDNAIKKYGEQHWLEHMPQETQQYVGRNAANLRASGVSIRIDNSTGNASTVTAAQFAR